MATNWVLQKQLNSLWFQYSKAQVKDEQETFWWSSSSVNRETHYRRRALRWCCLGAKSSTNANFLLLTWHQDLLVDPPSTTTWFCSNVDESSSLSITTSTRINMYCTSSTAEKLCQKLSACHLSGDLIAYIWINVSIIDDEVSLDRSLPGSMIRKRRERHTRHPPHLADNWRRAWPYITRQPPECVVRLSHVLSEIVNRSLHICIQKSNMKFLINFVSTNHNTTASPRPPLCGQQQQRRRQY